MIGGHTNIIDASGRVLSREYHSLVTRYDPVTGIWDTCAPLPEVRIGLYACEIDGKIYAMGGRRSLYENNLRLVEVYDIEKNEWSTGTSMPSGTAFAAGCVLDGKIYVMGGLKNFTSERLWIGMDTVMRYDPVADTWDTLAKLEHARAFIQAGAVSGKIYAIGGLEGPNARALTVVEVYDPATNTWTEMAEMPSRRGGGSSVVINDRIWTFCGFQVDPRKYVTETDIYDPSQNRWSIGHKADWAPFGIMSTAAAIYNKKVYVFGGYGDPDDPLKHPDAPDILEFDFPVVRLLNDTLLTTEQNLMVRFYENGDLYIVPKDTPPELDSILGSMISSLQGSTGQELSMPLDTFPSGTYSVYGLASDGRIDGAVAPLHVISPTYLEIPDTVFRDALVSRGIDSNGDNRISLLEAEPVQSMDVSHKGISDLTGIEGFMNLDNLDCSGNMLTGLDVSGNNELKYLNASGNQLISINIPHSLKVLDCSGNLLTHLDISWCGYLSELQCSENYLSSLVVMNCSLLANLKCGGNALIELDISRNLYLKYLSIAEMPTLCKVCVPSISLFDFDATGSPNIFFTIRCIDKDPPTVSVEENHYQPTQIVVTSSENGIIYLAGDSTARSVCSIREACIDSARTTANDMVVFSDSLEGLANGVYWVYALDESYNLSEPAALTITGVGIDQLVTQTVRIFPNPFVDLITIETNRTEMHVFEITCVNGQVIHRGSFFGPSDQIDLSNLQRGIYFIKLRSRDLTIMRKVVKR
jgi:N-acetylneuraminic acid mutarotase